MPGEIMSIKEVAEYLGIHEITIYKLANEGRLPGFKVGGQWRFQKDVLDKWIVDETHKQQIKKTEKEVKPEFSVDVPEDKLNSTREKDNVEEGEHPTEESDE